MSCEFKTCRIQECFEITLLPAKLHFWPTRQSVPGNGMRGLLPCAPFSRCGSVSRPGHTGTRLWLQWPVFCVLLSPTPSPRIMLSSPPFSHFDSFCRLFLMDLGPRGLRWMILMSTCALGTQWRAVLWGAHVAAR